MRTKLLALALLLAVVSIGLLSAPANAHAQHRRVFVTVLSGAQEVPAVNTRARGLAAFMLSRDGMELRFILIAANIQNVTMAHIHLAPRGENGPIVVWLYPSTPPPVLIPGKFNGVLASGTITQEDFVGPLVGMPFDTLIGEIMSGNAYVNVHTQQNPGGEIRGQL